MPVAALTVYLILDVRSIALSLIISFLVFAFCVIPLVYMLEEFRQYLKNFDNSDNANTYVKLIMIAVALAGFAFIIHSVSKGDYSPGGHIESLIKIVSICLLGIALLCYGIGQHLISETLYYEVKDFTNSIKEGFFSENLHFLPSNWILFLPYFIYSVFCNIEKYINQK